MLMGLHHVQLAMPQDGEADARAFYSGVLRMYEEPKPPELAKKGGVWFQTGSVRVHLGVETPFAASKKAHPGFLVASLSMARDALDAAGVTFESNGDFPGFNRLYVSDPFGNRIELLERAD
ncbi:VOC family protein [Oceaniglobus ichthyenteri]|uniref:VOC family protein n=1 Tax=Oceaniglobus ichthyenteri TaxID=2136177 RepID=UPI000D38D789|nr:VOC family protein [Oceaniglobus ichthyenteri]